MFINVGISHSMLFELSIFFELIKHYVTVLYRYLHLLWQQIIALIFIIRYIHETYIIKLLWQQIIALIFTIRYIPETYIITTLLHFYMTADHCTNIYNQIYTWNLYYYNIITFLLYEIDVQPNILHGGETSLLHSHF